MNWLRELFGNRTFGAARSSSWAEFRKINLNDRCEVCGKKWFLELHHIKPFHLHPELELDVNNVVTLCRTHHFEWGHFFNWKKFNEDIISWINKRHEKI